MFSINCTNKAKIAKFVNVYSSTRLERVYKKNSEVNVLSVPTSETETENEYKLNTIDVVVYRIINHFT
jgi:hypothetical protein